jgi:deoxyribodipyrimidine photolyase-related protein
MNIRRLVVILGDQLTLDNPALQGFDPAQDCVWMAEVAEESTKVWTHKARIVLFLSAMRHFRQLLESKGYPLHYVSLDEAENQGSLVAQLQSDLTRLSPQSVYMTEAGEWDVAQGLQTVVGNAQIPCEIFEDTHFFCSKAEFAQHAKGKKQLRMEFFYRWMRQKYNVLMHGADPEGGRWNYDQENRGSFDKSGPGAIPEPIAFPPDEITQSVINLVAQRFPNHPGQLDAFDWPMTPEQAELALQDFIDHRLPLFGQYQDAMWQDARQEQPYLYHSRLSAAMNLKLLDPRRVISAAESAYHQGKASLEAVEGFIRQVLGWREYVRGIYWLHMPDYRELNALQANQPLPDFYWTGQTEMACLNAAIGQTLRFGYAHHIQRLMVTGLFALMLGVNPKTVHEWYLAVYVDALEWVELPNTLGMSQFGDGGIMASKPYAATGKYIQRMSNHCQHCPYNPAERLGPKACPFTTLYWDFLIRHRALLSKNLRMGLQLKNVDRLDAAEMQAIQEQADGLRLKLQAKARQGV